MVINVYAPYVTVNFPCDIWKTDNVLSALVNIAFQCSITHHIALNEV